MKRLNVNMASSPFINRAVLSAILSTVLGAVLLFTALNVASFSILGRSYRKEKGILRAQEARLSTLKREITGEKKLLTGGETASLSKESGFLAGVLAAKRFSWTHFLDDLERVKPYGVMFVSVSPQSTKESTVKVNLRGVANPRKELLELENNFFNDSAFRNAEVTAESKNEGNPWTTFQISVEYLPEAVRER